MTSIRAPRRLSAPLALAFLAAFAVVLVPSAPASAATQGVTGTVTGSGGPLQGIEVDFLALQPGGSWAYANTTATDAAGNYAEPLAPGTYRVAFSDPDGQYVDEFYDDVTTFDAAADVQVDSGVVRAHIDADLALAGHITGHLTGSDGAPIPDAWVDAYTYDGQQWDYAPAWGVTDQNGDYDVSAAPGTYRLEFNADGYLGEFYDDAATVADGVSIAVASGQTVSGKDAVLERGATLSGTVTLPSDAALDDSDRIVTVVDAQSGKPVDEEWLDPGAETAPGSLTYPWSSVALPAGDYRVEFGLLDGPATAEGEYFDNHPESAGAASADTLHLTAGQQRTGIDATLRAGGTISGTVVNGDGTPAADCAVLAVDSAGKDATRVGTTAADGTFVVGGLTSGDYDLVVGLPAPSGPCNVSEYYTNPSGDLSPSPAGAIAIPAAPGSDATVAATLVYQGSLPTVSNTNPPTVPSAAPVVGTPVTANPGTWDPAGASLAYQWRANGVPIAGATAASYTPDSSVIGMALSVTVTASKSGYNAGAATSNQTAAVLGTAPASVVQNYLLPSVAGTPRIGYTLVADRGSWTDGATITTQWLRDGVPIPGANGPTYAPGPADVGARIAVTVTATKNGLTPARRTTAPTDPVQLGVFTLTGLPHLLGKLRVGRTLRALPQTSSPAASTVRYRWLRNGVPIKGRAGKQAAYRLVNADRGKRISVRVVVLRPGYTANVAIATKRGTVR